MADAPQTLHAAEFDALTPGQQSDHIAAGGLVYMAVGGWVPKLAPTLSRPAFDALSQSHRTEFMRDGGTVFDPKEG